MGVSDLPAPVAETLSRTRSNPSETETKGNVSTWTESDCIDSQPLS